MKKAGLLILSLVFIAIYFVQASLGFFDKPSISDRLFVPIGVWSPIEAPATPENVEDYLDTLETIIETHPNLETVDITEYLEDLLFEEGEDGKLLNEIFEDYTLGEIIETIDLIIEFAESFLVFDEDNNPVFPNPSLVSAIDIDFGGALNPGEHRIVHKVLQTANLSANQWWSPFALQLTMEAPDGADISDYVIEVLIDASPFDEDAPFSYNYLIRDKNSWNVNRAQGKVARENNALVPVAYDIIFNSVVYRNKGQGYVPVNYRHGYQPLQFSGSWSRFPVGPNIYLGAMTSEYGTPIGAQQEILLNNNPATRTGLILIGKSNGLISELRIDIPERRARTGDNIPIIPLAIVISRGLELDANGNPLPEQSSAMIPPQIKLRVIEGTVWIGDE